MSQTQCQSALAPHAYAAYGKVQSINWAALWTFIQTYGPIGRKVVDDLAPLLTSGLTWTTVESVLVQLIEDFRNLPTPAPAPAT